MVTLKKATGGREDPNFEQSWEVLATAFSQIHHKNASTLSFEELFRSAYKLVLKKKHTELYANVTNFERSWLRDNVKIKVASHVAPTLLAGMGSQSSDAQANERRQAGERFMICVKDVYSDQSLSMNMITDVLMYMVSPPVLLRNSDAMLTDEGPSLTARQSPAVHIHQDHGSLPLGGHKSQS